MMSMTRDEWMKNNQSYLIAEINVIKAKLTRYITSQDEEGADDGSALATANRELEKIKESTNFRPRLDSLCELCQLSSFERNVILMAIGVELDASFGKLVAKAHGDSSYRVPSVNLALSLFSDAHWSAITINSPLRYWNLIKLSKNEVLTASVFSIDELILHYLIGIDSMDRNLSAFVSPISFFGDLVPSHQKIAERITTYLSKPTTNGGSPLIQLEGQSIRDQKAIITKIFSTYNVTLYNVSTELLPENFNDLVNFIQLWNREAMLHQHVLFVDAVDLSSSNQAKMNSLKYLIEKTKGIVIVSTSFKWDDLSREVHRFEIKKPLRNEQELLWREQLGSLGDSLNGAIDGLVAQFNLDSYSITHIAEKAVANQDSNGMGIKEKLWNSCSDHTRPKLSNLAQRIETSATWDDLVLPDAQRVVLEEISIHVKQRQKVYYDWGFREKSNRGLGISALFAGESGTGKTMAAEVIANALQLDLYRIDLSQVINKYIGETEKNLKKIFDAAEDSGAILLFDEADALFGKRSEVKDSHDRHSNVEVSYLLQKMEEYRGLAILTTNLKNALDKAFLRRIRFVISFPFPDAEMRGEIWKKAFPDKTPTHGLSFPKLANLNVAGGNIRNIALNASFAAAHGNEAVTMRHIHHAARNEYVKLEKHMSPSESLI